MYLFTYVQVNVHSIGVAYCHQCTDHQWKGRRHLLSTTAPAAIAPAVMPMFLAPSPPPPVPPSPGAGVTLASALAEAFPATAGRTDSCAAFGPCASVCAKALYPELGVAGAKASSCAVRYCATGSGGRPAGEASINRGKITEVGAASAAVAAAGARAAPGARAGAGAGAVVRPDAGAGKAAYMGKGIPYGSNDAGAMSGPGRGTAP